jgi:hypothetical protein
MTEEAIIDNYKRLLQFYKEDRMFEIKDYSAKGLLELYGRILDYYGAHMSALSLLYLTNSDYTEMEYYCMTQCESFHKHESSFGFTALGYNWTVINK